MHWLMTYPNGSCPPSAFEDRYGQGAVELDAMEALHPGELARIIREAAEPYRDHSLETRLQDAADQAQGDNEAAWEEATADSRRELHDLRRQAQEISARYQAQLEELNEQLQADLQPVRERLELVGKPSRARPKPSK
jgi:hypothetical protein